MNKERVDAHIKTLSELELSELIKITAQNVHRLTIRKNNALNREVGTSAFASKANRTTLYAKSRQMTDVCNQEVELLKYLVSKL